MTPIAPSKLTTLFLGGLCGLALNPKCRLRFSILAVGVIFISGCSTGNASREVVSPVESAAASTPVIAVQPELSSFTNTITGEGIVGVTTWNGHLVPYVQNTGAGNFHTDKCPPYGSLIISDVEDVYYSKRVTVFDNKDPGSNDPGYTYTLWESHDLNSHCWIQLDCRHAGGTRIELFDTLKQPGIYMVTRGQ